MSADMALQLFELYRQELRAFLSRRGVSPQDMEDVLQEVFLRFARKVESGAAIGDPMAYLFGIARNVLIDTFRRRPPNATDLEFAEVRGECLESGAPEDSVRSRKLQQALASLPPAQQAMLALWKREKLSYKEISKRMGYKYSHHTVRKYLKRALARLRELMGESGNSED